MHFSFKIRSRDPRTICKLLYGDSACPALSCEVLISKFLGDSPLKFSAKFSDFSELKRGIQTGEVDPDFCSSHFHSFLTPASYSPSAKRSKHS